MKSITVHGLDDSVYELLKSKAQAEGRSLNKTTKGLLQEALGVHPMARSYREDFMDLFASWTEEDLRDFEQATAELRQVDPGDWQ
jgi:hypothetical protein